MLLIVFRCSRVKMPHSNFMGTENMHGMISVLIIATIKGPPYSITNPSEQYDYLLRIQW